MGLQCARFCSEERACATMRILIAPLLFRHTSMYLPPYKLASGVFPLRARVCVQLAAAVACWLVWSSSHEDAVTETPPLSAAILALLVGWSRVQAGLHYPTDVRFRTPLNSEPR